MKIFSGYSNAFLLTFLFAFLLCNTAICVTYQCTFMKRDRKRKAKATIELDWSETYVISLTFLPALIIFSEMLSISISLLQCQGSLIDGTLLLNPVNDNPFCQSTIYRIIQIVCLVNAILNLSVLAIILIFVQPRINSDFKLLNNNMVLDMILLAQKILVAINSFN